MGVPLVRGLRRRCIEFLDKEGEDIHLLLQFHGGLHVSRHNDGLRGAALRHLVESIQQH